MADSTHIEWTDATWNPITGCSVVSAGCKHCYAMRLAGTRLKQHRSRAGLTSDTKAGPVWTGEVRLNPEWLDQPLRWKRPRMIFVCAHGDLFHESVPDDWIDRVFAIMALSPQHTFQVLTKRADRMHAYMTHDDGFGRWGFIDGRAREYANIPPGKVLIGPLQNVWLGVSVEHQEAADERIPLLLQTPAAVRWISAEPLLGPITVFDLDGPIDVPSGTASPLHWVVAGGESGPGSRPMHPNWARSLRDQCHAAGVPFLFKQWGSFAPGNQAACGLNACYDTASTGGWVELDGRFSLGDAAAPGPHGAHVFRVGKKAAGRMLDSVLHDAYPVPPC